MTTGRNFNNITVSSVSVSTDNVVRGIYGEIYYPPWLRQFGNRPPLGNFNPLFTADNVVTEVRNVRPLVSQIVYNDANDSYKAAAVQININDAGRLFIPGTVTQPLAISSGYGSGTIGPSTATVNGVGTSVWSFEISNMATTRGLTAGAVITGVAGTGSLGMNAVTIDTVVNNTLLICRTFGATGPTPGSVNVINATGSGASNRSTLISVPALNFAVESALKISGQNNISAEIVTVTNSQIKPLISNTALVKSSPSITIESTKRSNAGVSRISSTSVPVSRPTDGVSIAFTPANNSVELFTPPGATKLLGIQFNSGALTVSGTYTLTQTGTLTFPTTGGVLNTGHAVGWNMSSVNLRVNQLVTPTTNRNKTYVAWYKGTQTASGGTYSPSVPIFGDISNSVWYGLGISAGRICVANVTQNIGSTSVNTNNWFCLAWVVKSNYQVDAYVNGVRELNNISVDPTNPGTSYIGAGFAYAGTESPTALDAIQIIDGELIASQILEIYNQGSGLSNAPPEFYSSTPGIYITFVPVLGVSSYGLATSQVPSFIEDVNPGVISSVSGTPTDASFTISQMRSTAELFIGSVITAVPLTGSIGSVNSIVYVTAINSATGITCRALNGLTLPLAGTVSFIKPTGDITAVGRIKSVTSLESNKWVFAIVGLDPDFVSTLAVDLIITESTGKFGNGQTYIHQIVSSTAIVCVAVNAAVAPQPGIISGFQFTGQLYTPPAPPSLTLSIEYLMVGGGGGGADGGGGGGAGGVLLGSAVITNQSTYPIVIGAGGAGGNDTLSASPTGAGQRGADTTFNALTTLGGGGGGSAAGLPEGTFGSGGGAFSGSGRAGTAGQGFDGGAGNGQQFGGGGGAGAVGGTG